MIVSCPYCEHENIFHLNENVGNNECLCGKCKKKYMITVEVGISKDTFSFFDPKSMFPKD